MIHEDWELGSKYGLHVAVVARLPAIPKHASSVFAFREDLLRHFNNLRRALLHVILEAGTILPTSPEELDTVERQPEFLDTRQGTNAREHLADNFGSKRMIPIKTGLVRLVDNKICSVSDTTSAMRFVIRKVDRVYS